MKNSDDLSFTINEFLEDIKNEVTETTKKVVEENAELLKKKVQQDSPKRKGKYSKGWKCKKAYESPTEIRFTINNPKHDPLVHLLEFGHASRNGGRVRAYPHLFKNYKEVKDKLAKDLSNKL